MAEQDQEKTEQATPKRKEEAREKGQVAKSREVSSAAILIGGLVYLWFGAVPMMEKIMKVMKKDFAAAATVTLSVESVPFIITGLIYDLFSIVLPFFLLAACVALIVNLVQTGFVFSGEPLVPKWSRINPVENLKRLFSLQALVELTKNLLKVAIIGITLWLTIRNELNTVPQLVSWSVPDIVAYVGKVAFRIMTSTCWILIVLAVLDFIYQHWEHMKSLKMTKQEVKEEYKQLEGDPLVKGRIRRIQREMARKRMMAAVPKADVVITNPTHYAVALRYEQEKMAAPTVVAKGTEYLAEKIKEIARLHHVPIVENREVAQMLFKLTEVGEVIPETLYRAVAEILAYVYRIRENR
ncbi:MAG TPA: flagellar biosynthesis protein FlhB [Syntrophales bacterium]|nr:flagellar biosynthesis protein FlhB [Syntrophales bacterium]HOL60049.1 flagellar biosynthesis protein FlhB [Syntrophales bacterium]